MLGLYTTSPGLLLRTVYDNNRGNHSKLLRENQLPSCRLWMDVSVRFFFTAQASGIGIGALVGKQNMGGVGLVAV